MIHFRCPQCGAAFDVDDRFAGKTGRCKSCSGRTRIPAGSGPSRPRELATAGAGQDAGGFRLSPIENEPAARPGPSLAAGRPINWLEAVKSQVALAPITADGMPALRPKQLPVDEPSITGPYRVLSSPSLPALDAAGGRPAGRVTRGYRHAMGSVQKLFRWLNQSAYLVSVPFLMLVLIGLVVGSRSLMVLGATVVVLLNIGRIVAGVANLVVIPFRESPVQGLLFLIPPITFFYLAQNWNKVRKPVKRIIGPILTILMVGLAYAAEPWMHGEERPTGSLKQQVKDGFRSAAQEIKGKAGGVTELDLEGLSKLKSQAIDSLKAIKSGGAPGSPEEGAKAPK